MSGEKLQNMFKRMRNIAPLFIIVLAIMVCACSGSDQDYLDDDGENIIISELVCSVDNDCDGDGLYTSCDDDDGDADNVTIKDGCDDDGDGFVDTNCYSYADENGDGFVTADERDVNCDVCVGTYDPEQIDSNDDGIGDECEFSPNINESVIPDEEDGDEESEDVSNSLALTITDHPTAVSKGGEFDIDFTIDNQSDIEAYFVEVLFMKDGNRIMSFSIQGGLEYKINTMDICYSLYSTCVFLDEQTIEALTGQTTDYELSFAVPSTMEMGTYRIALRLTYLDENGDSQYAARLAGLNEVNVLLMKTRVVTFW